MSPPFFAIQGLKSHLCTTECGINMTVLKLLTDMKKANYSALRYWLLWGLLIGGLMYGFHLYLEYRNHELDKRLEQLR